MNINRNNYERYFVDYLEGTLSRKDTHDLKIFLLLNEDLAELLEEMKGIRLNPPILAYTHKNHLKKDELHGCKDYYAIALAEHSLTPQDLSDIGRFSGKQEIEEQAKIYRKLKLQPDPQIRYTPKSKLYRQTSRKFIYRYSSIAAAILLFTTIGITISESNREPQSVETAMFLPPAIEISPFEPIVIAKQQPENPIPVPEKDRRPALPSKRIPVVSIKKLPVSGITQQTIPESNQIRLAPSFLYSPELILSENALEWKPSENKFLSNNLIASVIHTGKIIAEKLKAGSNK